MRWMLSQNRPRGAASLAAGAAPGRGRRRVGAGPAARCRQRLQTVMRRSIMLLALAAGWRTAAQLPEPYRLIYQRSIFNPNRGPVAVRNEAPPPPAPPPAPTESITLTGVAVLDGRATALFDGSSAGLAGSRRLGERVDPGEVAAIDTEGVTLRAGDGTTLALAVGQTLVRSPGQSWRLGDGPGVSRAAIPPRPPSTEAAAPSAASSGPAAAGGAASGSTPARQSSGSAADMIRQMLERRQRELRQ